MALSMWVSAVCAAPPVARSACQRNIDSVRAGAVGDRGGRNRTYRDADLAGGRSV